MTATTYEEAARTRDDKAMMLHPEWWFSAVLPMKRVRDGNLESHVYGVVDGAHVLYEANVFAFDRDAPSRTYATIDAILAEGWIVD